MLNKIFSFFKGLGTKTLIVLIVLSFALWGVGDIFTNNKNPVIAKVGDNEIKLNEFNLEYQSVLQNLRSSSKENLTDEFVRAMGLHNTVLDNLITQKYLNIISQDLGLSINDKYLKKSIISNPLFKDQLGVFNKDYFTYYLNQNNLSEKELLEISKKVLLNDLLVKSLSSASNAPQTMTNNFLKRIDIARKANIYYFDGSALLLKEKITNKMLLNKYEKVKNNFLTPESRSFTLIKINKNKIIKDINITSKQINEVYNTNKDAYQIKESRKTYQPIFKTKEMAEKFIKTVKNKNFFDALVDNNINKKDVYLGEVYRNDFDKTTDNIIFSLQENQISDIQKDSFGYKLYYIEKIKNPTQLTSQEIMKKIKEDLTREQLFKLTYEQADKIFEDFLESNDIDKAISNKNVVIRDFKKITLNDIEDISTKIKIDVPSEELAKYIFNTDANQISDLIEDKGDNVYFVYIKNIELPAVQKFDEVKEKITNIVYTEKQAEIAKKDAERFLLDPSKIIKSKKNTTKSNYEFAETNWLTMENNKGEQYSTIIQNAIFKTKIDTYSGILQIEKNKYAIIKPTKQKTTNLSNDKKYIDTIKVNLKSSINNDLIEAILYDLKSKVKKSINKNFLNSF